MNHRCVRARLREGSQKHEFGHVAPHFGKLGHGRFFEVTSAFGTVGLSTGITAGLPVNAQLVLIVLMFLGRIGTITVSTALALSLRPRLFQLPEERPIIG